MAGSVPLSSFSLQREGEWGAEGPAQCAEGKPRKAVAVSLTQGCVAVCSHLLSAWREPSLGLGQPFWKPEEEVPFLATPSLDLVQVSAPAFSEMHVCKSP